MPVEVGRFTTEVSVHEGELPLSAGQVEKLVELVLRRLEERQRQQDFSREATTIRRQAGKPRSGEGR